MGKSDDSISRRKNRKNRKKQEDRKVSHRIAALIAAKKRRKSGKRRLCQGMCFSLPTLEDPFNDRHDEKEPVKKMNKPSRSDKIPADGKLAKSGKHSDDTNSAARDVRRGKVAKLEKVETEPIRADSAITDSKSAVLKNVAKQGTPATALLKNNGDANDHEGQEDLAYCPSKFLILCLNSIQNALRDEVSFSSKGDRPLFVHKWGFEFWKFYSSGQDILETSRADSTNEEIAWVASCAADTIAGKEKEGLMFSSPFLLFLLPSQEKAVKARHMCKPLKALGIHSVSLHSGASIDHQIQGLKSCEPEFLLSTPQRLLELISLNEIDISGVSLLVVDGLKTRLNDGFLESIKLIRQSISGRPQTVVFSDCSGDFSTQVLENLLQEPFHRISLDDIHALDEQKF